MVAEPVAVIVGLAFTATVTVLVDEPQPRALPAVKVYTPAAAAVTFVIVGFCELDINPFGPDQLHVVALVALPVKFNVAPVHKGVLAPAAVPVGAEFIVIRSLTV